MERGMTTKQVRVLRKLEEEGPLEAAYLRKLGLLSVAESMWGREVRLVGWSWWKRGYSRLFEITDEGRRALEGSGAAQRAHSA